VDLDLSGLSVWVSCGDALARSYETVHLCLGSSSGVHLACLDRVVRFESRCMAG
jgi:hypothetical protein